MPRNICTLTCKQHRHGAANARVAAGNQRCKAVELAADPVVGSEESWLQCEVSLAARLRQALRRHQHALAARTCR